MKVQPLVSACALGLASVLVWPTGNVQGFTTYGVSLSAESQRDFRIRNQFRDPQSNDNQTPDPMFPGWQGADMALWKAAVEWGSRLHGDGSGHPGNLLGEGGANFDFSFQGRAAGPGQTNHNIVGVDEACGGGVLAFVELPINNGWRMKFCDDFTWSDGPGNAPGGQFSIQGVATHEFGHALGLGHSVSPAVMKPSTGSGNDIDNLMPDDIAGVQAIYGPAFNHKPVITDIQSVCTGVIEITGMNFSDTGGEVWFTNAGVTGTSTDPRIRALGVASTGGGTTIVVGVPEGAGPGDVLVKQNGTGHFTLSNAWPFDPPVGADGTAITRNGSGSNAVCFTQVSPPNIGEPWETAVALKPQDDRSLVAVSLNGALCHPGGLTPALLQGTELLARSPYVLPHDVSNDGVHKIQIAPDCSLVGQSFCVQGFGIRLNPLQVFGFNALEITLGDG